MSFLGRKRELSFLAEAWRSERSAFIPIYGRRRVGKSELIVHFMQAKKGLYFVGKRAPGEAQRHEFLEAAARALGEPLLARTQVTSWKEALKLVEERLPEQGKFILALDEFQWTAEASPELPSVLQELWDRDWSHSGRFLLVLCGSYLGFMERDILGKSSPLFGRRTGQILLRPFDYLEAAAFHPNFARAEQACVYALCGGVPAYLLAFEQGLSVEANLMAQLLNDNAALAREPEFLLREELRELASYHAVLMALAESKSSPAQLSTATGLEARLLNYYLNTLVGLGYVQRCHPLTSAKPNKRTVRYMLDDPLLRFWFRFVFPRQSLLRLLGPQRGFTELVKPGLDAYFGRCFERLCREALPLLYLREGIRAPFVVGEYWDDQVQIDVVGLREDNWTDLGECKWGNVTSWPALNQELDAKLSRYPNKRNATLGRRLFVKSFKAKHAEYLPSLRVHSLKELYSLGSVS